MPFFNFRRAASNAPNAQASAQPESMDVVRKRARHRLIGAAVLVLAGVVGFPLLFDTQPRPIAVDIPIEIPGKNSVRPLVMPGTPEAAKGAAKPSAPPAVEKVAAASSLDAKEEILLDKKPPSPVPAATAAAAKKESEPALKPELKAAQKPVPKLETKPEAKTEAKTETKPALKPDSGARAKALLDGQPPADAPEAPTSERLVVQVGAFADADKAQEVRLKLERAGLKTYTQVAETKDGKRIRVRVGPFASKPEADKAASKIKTLDLPAAILAL